MFFTRRWFTAHLVLASFLVAGCGGGGGEPNAEQAAAPTASEWMRKLAQTTPSLSNPGICDTLRESGVTPGLHGLCVAYCQALSCPDARTGAKAMSSQCQAASPQLLANYNKLRRDSDPQMPCVQPKCPCWTSSEAAAVGLSYSPHTVDVFWNIFGEFSSFALVENRTATDQFPYGAFSVLQINDNPNDQQCAYFNADFQPGAPAPTIRFQDITQVEVDACRGEIAAQVGRLRLIGVNPICSGNGCNF